MMKKYLLLILLFSITFCTNKKTSWKNFSDLEYKTLNKIVIKNDSVFNQLYKSEDIPINEAYYNYLNEVSKKGLEGISNNIFYSDRVMINSLYELNFLEKKKTKFFESGKEGYSLELKIQSNYINFLEYVAVRNPVILEYLNIFKSTGALPPTSTLLLVNLKSEDLNDINIRLILGVHFLIINHQM